MGKILFFDTSNGGHHFYYNFAAMKGVIGKLHEIKCCYASPEISGNIINKLEKERIDVYQVDVNIKHVPQILQRIVMLIKLLYFAKKRKYRRIHLFYLDGLIIPLLFVWPLIYLFHVQITATLHWFPNRKSKIIGMRFLLKQKVLSKIIVHGDYTRNLFVEQLGETYNNNKINCINYPNLHPIIKNNIDNDSIIINELKELKRPYILCFGGLRFDKGIDILIKAANKIKEVDFTLIIAGKEEYFKRDYLEQLIKENGLEQKVYLNLEFIPDEMVSSYFNISDMVVLPYRKYFTGQSGPLTEGVIRKKIIIGPDNGEIGFTIKKYNLGTVFLSENIKDLAEKLIKSIKNIHEIRKNIYDSQDNYSKMIDSEVFETKYYDFFRK
ncbi:hypothetical protein A8709_22975 [Paenibacillus pectinilyticus]|uniref:Glycosyl transferase family 1 domain-containing protein n=1 Tax=Paenibacillus pectinilyticus TaxID=512399 RepID=A0A1C0ZRK3_9BACL|nr:glycosyltransferase family 4 protein [Paenibacillus pectinilyticus]OCT10703.1 hypothetical protein A8709_22975 [Paenibacillus pectinilyticus]